MKRLPLSNDDFRLVREANNYYIDKSLFIKDFLDYGTVATLITRPRRFGKTLNMTMLREFLDVTKDSRSLFEDLAIMKTDYAETLNRIPVIFLTLKNCEAQNINDLLWLLASELFKEYEKYRNHFSNQMDLNVAAMENFEETYKYLRKLVNSKTENDTPIVNNNYFKTMLDGLIHAISVFFGQNPIVLIDEYDQPILSAHKYGFRETFSEIYSNMLTRALKGNPYLRQVLMTGIQRVAKESIFSKLNHFMVYTVIDDKYASRFGLTSEETRQALEDFNMELTFEVRQYYDGYRFGNIEIYNPWSILSYIEKKKLKSYWMKTSTNALIRESILNADHVFKQSFERLIEEGVITVNVNWEAAFIELKQTPTLWGLLLNAGYITQVDFITDDLISVKIPNQEALKEFRSIIADYANLDENRLTMLFHYLITGKMDEFLACYREIVYECVSYHDKPEQAYHSMFLGMAISLYGLYEWPQSNKEFGNGRADIVLKSKFPNQRPHMVIEFKVGDDLVKEKEDALVQIFKKKYFKTLHGPVLCVGIAHNGKDCDLIYEWVEQ